MTFQFDKTGAVQATDAVLIATRRKSVRWSDLSPFTQGYIETLFATELSDGAQLRGKHIPLAFSDLAPETLARIIEDCEAWRSTDRGVYGNDWQSARRAFWAIRQSEVGHPDFPPLTVQLGDDGKVRFA